MTREFVRIFALAAFALSFAAGRGNAQAGSELHGRLVNQAGEPIAGAMVTLAAIRYSVRTDSLGRFRLAGTPGSTLSLFLQAPGFREDTVGVVLSRGRPVVRDFVLVSELVASPVDSSDRPLRVRVTTTEGEPIAYANLQVNGGRRYVSDDSGRFRVAVTTAGRTTLLFRRIGFEPSEIELTEMPDTVVQVRMTALPTALPGQVVTVRSPYVRLDLGGFYRRMAEAERGATVAYFVTPEDLALRKPPNVTNAVEQFPSIRIRPIDDGKINPVDGMAHGDGVPLNRKVRIEDRNGCPMTVYLDRVRIQPSFAGSKAVDEEVNTIVQAHNVAGIEVYPRGVGAPPEFPAFRWQSGMTCGVVLIWTK